MNAIRIKQWMLGAGVMQKDLSEKSGLSRSYVSLVIDGKRKNPTIFLLLEEMGCPKKFLR
jgi:transcriptional regulator with XRE-family HTH domain